MRRAWFGSWLTLRSHRRIPLLLLLLCLIVNSYSWLCMIRNEQNTSVGVVYLSMLYYLTPLDSSNCCLSNRRTNRYRLSKQELNIMLA